MYKKKLLFIYKVFFNFEDRFWIRMEIIFLNCKGVRVLFWIFYWFLGCCDSNKGVFNGFWGRIKLYIKVENCWKFVGFCKYFEW